MEMVVATAILALVMAALSSAVVLATKALPDPDSPVEQIVSNADALQRFSDELSQATVISTLSTTGVQFSVPDRDEDGVDETIRYQWAGTTGDPLTRSINDGADVASISDVESLGLSPIYLIQTLTYPGPIVDSPAGTLENTSMTVDSSVSLTSSEWYSQLITPTLGSSAVTWTITRVVVRIVSDVSDGGQFLAQIRLANSDGTPSSYVVQQTVVDESSLPSVASMYQITFVDPVRLHRDTPVCLVLEHQSGAVAARVSVYSTGGSGMTKSTDNGASWVTEPGSFFPRAVFGYVGTPGADMSYTRRYLTGMGIDVQPGSDPRAAMRTGSVILNGPELAATRYQISFDTDPTTLDIDQSGVDDWKDAGGSTFDVGTIDGDVWTPTQTIESAETNDFTEPTVLGVRMMNTSVGEGAFVSINADWSGGTHAELEAYLIKIEDGSQALMLEHRVSLSKTEPICLFGGLGSGYIELELLIDPDADTVRVLIDGVDKGTFGYATVTNAHFEKVIRLGTRGAGAEFDAVDINVAEAI